MNIYILADGLSEKWSEGKTTLECSAHPHLDLLSGLRYTGLYEPARRPFVPNPETYVVFPYFFGLRPTHNPARAGLELHAAGISLDTHPLTSVFRLIPKDYDLRDGLDKTPPIPNLPTVERSIAGLVDELYPRIAITKSVISKKGNVWCVGATDMEAYEDFLNLLQYEAAKFELNCYPLLFQPYRKETNRVTRLTRLYGWTVGSLLNAMTLVGVENVQTPRITEHDLFNYEEKLRDFSERILPDIEERMPENESVIIYVKETSAAARYKTREEKIRAVQFVDTLVGNLIEASTKDTQFIFLSDHQSNIGVERTFKGPTLFLYGSAADISAEEPLHERRIARETKVISQSKLVSNIDLYLNSVE